MANEVIRQKAEKSGVRMWQIADKLHIADSTLTRRLRHELPAADQKHILELIDDIAEEVNQHGK